MSLASDLETCAKILREGGLVAMPTETVYGLAADATNPQAVAQIFEAKERPSFDPLIVHVASVEAAKSLAVFNPLALSLAERFWPGPLTMVLPKRDVVPGIVTSGLASVGLRMPRHPMARALLEACGKPLAAPSANPFGYVSPTCAQHVRDQLGERIQGLIDGGDCDVGVESTVVEVDADQIRLLRPGSITEEELAELGAEVVRGEAVHERPNAPGMLKSHYAPSLRLELLESDAPQPGDAVSSGHIAFASARKGFAQSWVLSEAGECREAAANLFRVLRELDGSGVRKAYIEPVPEHGVGIAVMDRIRRAVGL